jgi:TonB family protein
MADVIAVTRLSDGSPAPVQIRLPELLNRVQTIEFMLINYPESIRRDDTPRAAAIAWAFVDRTGRVADAQLLAGSGNATLDSLSLKVLGVALFKPATVGNDTVAVWVPYPVRVPTFSELRTASDEDASAKPVNTPFDVAPSLLNRQQVEAAIVRVFYSNAQNLDLSYVAQQRRERLGGTTKLAIYITPLGEVRNAVVNKTSGNIDLDNEAISIAKIMRFSPAKNHGQNVEAWIVMPIEFRASTTR